MLLSFLVATLCFSSPLLIEPSNASALNFLTEIDLSNNQGSSTEQQIAVNNNGNIYVVWKDDTPGKTSIFFANSTNGGVSFSDPISLTETSDASSSPQVAVSGDKVYVVWTDNEAGNGDIIFREGTITNGVLNFSGSINLSGNDNPSSNPQVAAISDKVYVTWEEDSSGIGYREILFTEGTITNGVLSFDTSKNLSNTTALDSFGEQIFATDNAVYLAWVEFDDSAFVFNVFLSAKLAGANDFTTPVNVSGDVLDLGGGFAQFPRLFVSDRNVFVAWSDAIIGDVYLRNATITDSASLGGLQNLSNNGASAFPAIFASGNNVFVAWRDNSVGSGDIMLRTSSDGGVNFSLANDISNTPSSLSFDQELTGANNTVYLVWEEDNPHDALFAFSTDGGASFSSATNISNNLGSSSTAQIPKIAVFGDKVFLSWSDDSLANAEVFFKAIAPSGPASVSIENVDNPSPKWGIEQVTVSGTVNANFTDTVTVDWGDGTSDSDISIQGSSWGPTSHAYSSEHTGTNQVIAKLLNETGAQIAESSPSAIDVQKHFTTLTLNQILSVINGTDISVSGLLTDSDTSTGVENEDISFSGSGAANLDPASTLSSGVYSSSGASSSEVSDLLSVQAHFEGDDSYEISDSEVKSYDTVSSTAVTFDIPEGAPSPVVNLTGFGASIFFENVTAPGKILVSACDSPVSPRYIDLGLCLSISTAAEIAPGSGAHLSIAFGNASVPTGHDIDEIGLFHEGISGIHDITESRDLTAKVVTGASTDFSKFIVAVALHDSAPPGASRQEILVGHNELLFNFNVSREISFSSGQYNIGDTALISVVDTGSNLDGSEIEEVTANVTSSSDSKGIVIELKETGPDTGIFNGEITYSNDASSITDGILHVLEGDRVTASYGTPDRAPLKMSIDGVKEAGLMELTNYSAPFRFFPLGHGYNVHLIDAELGDAANITITMSYSDVQRTDFQPSDVRLMLFNGVNCLDQITLEDSDGNIIGVDTAAKTVTGVTNKLGQFAMGFPQPRSDQVPCHETGPGGAGGGPISAGIVVVDSIASIKGEIVNSHTGGGGGGGGGARTTSAGQLTTGSDIETTLLTGTSSITFNFENIEPGSGQLKISAEDLLKFTNIFDGVVTQQGHQTGVVNLDDSAYSTIGRIFDIDASAVKFNGMVKVTIPYDEKVALLSGSESNVRFLHYDAKVGHWEDATIAFDTEKNTVTGMMDSLSPVVAAVVDDSTFAQRYFELNPLGKIVTEPKMSTDVKTNENFSISLAIQNVQRTNQNYAFIVQVLDSDNIVQWISWQQGSIARGQDLNLSSIWIPETEGKYTIQIFMWDGLDTPLPLSSAAEMQVTVHH